MSPNKEKANIKFVLNGESAEVAFAPHKTLLEVLREDHQERAQAHLPYCKPSQLTFDTSRFGF